MNSTVPLDQALPWSPEVARKILVCDSFETDGRFLLHTLAAQVLNNNNNNNSKNATTTTTSSRVLWLSGSPITDRQVATAMKKIGCDAAAAYLRDPSSSNSNKNLTIRPLATEIATQCLKDENFDGEVFLKDVYKQVKTWLVQQQQQQQEQQQTETSKDPRPCWIFVDDVSSLAAMLGDDAFLVYRFVDSLGALAARLGTFGMVIRCSHDLDHQTLHSKKQDSNNGDDVQDNSGWMGAGGLAHKEQLKHNQQTWIPWERSLESCVDAIVDVVPLTSGYSREAHGRLVFSECPGGRGWGDSSSISTHSSTSAKQQMTQGASWNFNKFVINYCLNDNGVRAIRLRGTS
jgi:hypothetical protein